jgi:hypothetical protein
MGGHFPLRNYVGEAGGIMVRGKCKITCPPPPPLHHQLAMIYCVQNLQNLSLVGFGGGGTWAFLHEEQHVEICPRHRILQTDVIIE